MLFAFSSLLLLLSLFDSSMSKSVSPILRRRLPTRSFKAGVGGSCRFSFSSSSPLLTSSGSTAGSRSRGVVDL